MKNEIFLNNDPQIKIYQNFLSETDCKKLINLSNGKLKQACVGNGTRNVVRTGSNFFINKGKNKFTLNITNKISEVIGISSKNATNLQIVNYMKNQTYAYHYDAFPKNEKGKLITCKEEIYQRNISIICYLNNVKKGGETYFPKIDLYIKPELGKMLVFSNTLKNTNDRHPNSIHAGLPVYEGEKWILVCWFSI